MTGEIAEPLGDFTGHVFRAVVDDHDLVDVLLCQQDDSSNRLLFVHGGNARYS
jgi:hypothetical protein